MGMFDIFSGKNIDTTVDAIVSTGDKLVYTDEEKADYNQKKRALKIELAKAMYPYKVAQRAIATMFTISFLVSFWTGVMIWFFNDSQLDKYISLVSSFNIGYIMMAIVSFYFLDGSMNWFKKVK